MKFAVLYYSRSGNTKGVAEAMAKALGAEAAPCTGPAPELEAELLFLGSGIYAGKPGDTLPAFVESLSPEKVRCAALFTTSLSGADQSQALRQALEKKGIPVVKEAFSCPGKFLLFHRKRPSQADFAAAAAYAKNTAEQQKREG